MDLMLQLHSDGAAVHRRGCTVSRSGSARTSYHGTAEIREGAGADSLDRKVNSRRRADACTIELGGLRVAPVCVEVRETFDGGLLTFADE